MARLSPYQDIPAHGFWRSAVVEQRPETLDHLHKPKFTLSPDTAIMTAGSCFAQHIHRRLTKSGWNVLQVERLPDQIPKSVRQQYGYDQFSARYGNIYTARQLRELIADAFADTPSEPLIWEREGRFFDALRPAVEPDGLKFASDVKRSRQDHLQSVRGLLNQTKVMVFTLGLTEAWMDNATGRALPTAPGTIAGTIETNPATFHNFSYPEILEDLKQTQSILKHQNLDIQILLTVSPVPLVATASGHHVGPASTYSKSVLRAVCGTLQDSDPDFDYFPSYEIITTPVVGGPFFARNLRDPSSEGVDTVFGVFSLAYEGADPPLVQSKAVPEQQKSSEDVQCEEILLETFRK
ncbi:GSCFA family protein [Phaeobacter gallaeciensis]|uniref:GSCFA family protein n=2 Tax=Roseobacteraceae TaxID=2854170 RepID=A0A366WKM3_9RHOB|nr:MULTISPECIES: GSCFA domain-containing protein [Roseobacteraceae]MBT3140058.1 GSCFA domain-containing protein [Falsiruegeria litorea]MBT8169182.1 GSCFA domain-containing protein [Falsiruegeria litorea]RBW50354.1 GSCFA family protein [Phaeobacter gallaeciensis]